MIKHVSSVICFLGTVCQTLQMTSLGSSFAAGPGLAPTQNYAHIAAHELGADLVDLSVSGSTLVTMRSQISRLPTNSSIVSITSGGNDLGYVAGLMAERWSSSLSSALATTVTEDQLLARFDEDLALIHGRAPNATVFLVEYATLLGSDVKPSVNVPFSAERLDHHERVAATLLNATRRAATGKTWVRLVRVADNSDDHGVGSVTPWVNGDVVGRDGGIAWHPNRAGMQAIARMLVDAISNSTVVRKAS